MNRESLDDTVLSPNSLSKALSDRGSSSTFHRTAGSHERKSLGPYLPAQDGRRRAAVIYENAYIGHIQWLDMHE